MSTDTPQEAAERRQTFRLLLSESSVAPDHDPFGVLDDEPRVPIPLCKTVGELIRANFLYLLDRGDLDTLRNLMEQAAEDYDGLHLPEVDGDC